MPVRLLHQRLVLRPDEGRAGRCPETAERHMPSGLDVVRLLLPAQREPSLSVRRPFDEDPEVLENRATQSSSDRVLMAERKQLRLLAVIHNWICRWTENARQRQNLRKNKCLSNTMT
jgi:hypothetical protein